MQPHNASEQHRFTGSGTANNAQNLSPEEIEIKVFMDDMAAKAIIKTPDFNDRSGLAMSLLVC
tara:strand:- start:325 stop:513 length:189 start_codon:yes stop_codon:yes gene_type:complete